MENPTLTFLTPTFIAGDRSLVGLVAHELAHTWSGNLVTNAVWSDSWLNEGFTSYFENRIMEALYGPERAAQEAALSWADMESALRREGRDSPDTALHLRRRVRTPAASGIVYDKGAVFLRTIERIVGRERFDAWLRSYFDRHAFQPMTSARFLADLRANLVRGDAALERRLMLDEWVYQPGPARQRGAARSGRLRRGRPARSPPYNARATPARVPYARLDHGRAAALPQRPAARSCRASGSRRSTAPSGCRSGQHRECCSPGSSWRSPTATSRRCRWPSGSSPRIGRRKFVLPLFETLMGEGEWGQPIAERVYARTPGRPITA